MSAPDPSRAQATTRPRVALVSLHTSPLATAGSGDAGGMNVYLRALADGLVADGFDVDVLTRRTDPAQRTITTPGGARMLHLEAGPAAPVAKELLPDLVAEFAERAVEAGPYDIVHSHYWLSGLAGARVAAASHAPHLVTLHTLAALKNELLAASDTPEPESRLSAERMLLRDAHTIVAVSRAEADAAVRLAGADPDRVRVVLPGVDRALFHPADGESFDTSARPTVVVAARVQPLKGQDLAIRAVAGIPAAERPRLVLAGDATASHASYVASLHDFARELGLRVGGEVGGVEERAGLDTIDTDTDTDTDTDINIATAATALSEQDSDVVFAGPLERERLAEALRAASVVVIPSHSETFGLVALEAAASGVPVLAARVGGLPEAVGANGTLLDDRDPRAWSAALADLLREARTDAGRTTQRERALAHASAFDWEAVSHRIGDLYRSLNPGPRSLIPNPSRPNR